MVFTLKLLGVAHKNLPWHINIQKPKVLTVNKFVV